MAKGKFKKQMHEKGMEIQNKKLNSDFRPTPQGYAVAKSYNHNSDYIDSFMNELFEESQSICRGRRSAEIKENSVLVRQRLNEFVFYINCPELINFSDRFNLITRGRTIYFVPNNKGIKLSTYSSKYPFLKTQLFYDQFQQLVDEDKEFCLHELVSKDNRKIWFIDV